MKREAFVILLIKGLGTVIFGNVLCLVMTMATFMFGSNFFTKALSIIFGVTIFYSLIFTVAWKNGTRERGLVKYRRIEEEKTRRWIPVGLIMFVFAAIPSIILLLNKLAFPEDDLLLIYQLVSGSAYPFVMTFVPPVTSTAEIVNRIDTLNVMFPILMIVYYALIPAAAQLGFICGYNDKLSSDKIIYK